MTRGAGMTPTVGQQLLCPPHKAGRSPAVRPKNPAEQSCRTGFNQVAWTVGRTVSEARCVAWRGRLQEQRQIRQQKANYASTSPRLPADKNLQAEDTGTANQSTKLNTTGVLLTNPATHCLPPASTPYAALVHLQPHGPRPHPSCCSAVCCTYPVGGWGCGGCCCLHGGRDESQA